MNIESITKYIENLEPNASHANELETLWESVLDKLVHAKAIQEASDTNQRIQVWSSQPHLLNHPSISSFTKFECKILTSVKVFTMFPSDVTLYPFYEHSGPISKFSIGYSSDTIKEAMLVVLNIDENILSLISEFADSEVVVSILEYWTEYKMAGEEESFYFGDNGASNQFEINGCLRNFWILRYVSLPKILKRLGIPCGYGYGDGDSNVNLHNRSDLDIFPRNADIFSLFDWARELDWFGFCAPWDRRVMACVLYEVGDEEFWKDLAKTWLGKMSLKQHKRQYGISMFTKSNGLVENRSISNMIGMMDILLDIVDSGEAADPFGEKSYDLDVKTVLQYLGDNFPDEMINLL